MPETLVRIASFALAGAFGWAAVAKLLTYARWQAALSGYGLTPGLARVAAPLVPMTELSIALTLALVSVRIGSVAAVGALALFSLAILRARAISGDRLPCGCFGAVTARDYRTMLLRNAALALLAAVGLASSVDTGGVMTSSSGADLSPVMFTMAGGVVAAWLVWYVSRVMRGHQR